MPEIVFVVCNSQQFFNIPTLFCRRPPHPANVAQASTSAAPRAGRLLLSPFEQQASPAQTPPQRCTTPAGLAAMSCGAQPTQRDVGPPLQGISTRRKMCVVPDPRATYRSHLRGSLGLSNMSLGVGGPPTATAAPDWYVLFESIPQDSLSLERALVPSS